ncbi:MAG: tRNA (adenosine(37)-N6)-dimethylallyltransferase MiaA [Alloprevotella sp.]
MYDFITLLGPTASGKTRIAARLARHIGAEIISADSRQVYRRMDLGTGKDLDDYTVDGEVVPYHLIDIAEPGEKYNVFRYQQDFLAAFNTIRQRGQRVIVCGGSGLYLESLLRGYKLSPVPQNEALRAALSEKSLEELTELLRTYRPLHNTTDTDTKPRAIRAIEIEDYNRRNPTAARPFPPLRSLTLGILVDRETRRRRITERLHTRLQQGMLQEVEALLREGIAPEDLIYYGLEYKYLTLCATGRLSYEEMERQLEIAIHQFAKRQMTWFRGMERRGTPIQWVEPPAADESTADWAGRHINEAEI